MGPGEAATPAWVVDVRVTGDRGGSPGLRGPRGLVWGGLTWGTAQLRISCPPWTSPTSICAEKVLALLTTGNPPSPKMSSEQEGLKGPGPQTHRGCTRHLSHALERAAECWPLSRKAQVRPSHMHPAGH